MVSYGIINIAHEGVSFPMNQVLHPMKWHLFSLQGPLALLSRSFLTWLDQILKMNGDSWSFRLCTTPTKIIEIPARVHIYT